MKWKIYFWLLCVLAVLSSIGVFFLPRAEMPIAFVQFVIFIGELVGLYAFLYHKTIVSRQMWFYFLWFNIVLDGLFFFYALFPQEPLIQWYSLVVGNELDTLGWVIISLLADMPLLYALYKLSRGEYYVAQSKQMRFVKPNIPKWGMLQTAMWGYSLFIYTIFVIGMVFPTESRSSASSVDYISNVSTIFPLVFFWVLIIVQLPRYKKTWWRLSLAANGFLFSLFMLIGIFMNTTDNEIHTEIDGIAFLQLLIVISALVVFGKEQFPSQEKSDITS